MATNFLLLLPRLIWLISCSIWLWLMAYGYKYSTEHIDLRSLHIVCIIIHSLTRTKFRAKQEKQSERKMSLMQMLLSTNCTLLCMPLFWWLSQRKIILQFTIHSETNINHFRISKCPKNNRKRLANLQAHASVFQGVFVSFSIPIRLVTQVDKKTAT